MTLQERLADFSGALTSAIDAPDGYPEWGYITYESNMADLKELWAEIREKLKHSHDKVPFIDEKLQEAFAAFDAGEKDKGVDAILAIYNIGVKKLR